MSRIAAGPLGYAPLRAGEAMLSAGRALCPMATPAGASPRVQVQAASYPVPAPSFAGAAGSFNLGETGGVLACLVWGNTWPTTTFPTDAYRSLDGGCTWERQAQAFGGEWRAQAAGAGRWVAVAGNSNTGDASAVSTDGLNWTRYTGVLPPDFWYGATFGGGLFRIGSYDGRTATSANGISWTGRTQVSTRNAEVCLYGAGVWVVGGRTATAGPRYSTDDGTTWQTPLGTAGVSYPGAVNLGAYAAGEFWVRDTTANQWWRSADGAAWRRAGLGSGVAPLWPHALPAAGLYVGEQLSADGEAFMPYLAPQAAAGGAWGASIDGGACWLEPAARLAHVVRTP